AFALVRNRLWGRPPVEGRNYLLQYLTWAFAWAPGLLALTLAGAERSQQRNAIAPSDLLARIDRGEALAILDVRSAGEFAAGHVPGAVNIPFDAVTSRMRDVRGSVDEQLFVYCGHGPRAYLAARSLRRGGRGRVVMLTGHFSAWRRAGLRVVR